MLHVDERIQVPLREFDFRFARSGGPGGQNVNKRNTRATLFWDVRASSSLPSPVRARFESRFRRRIRSDGVLVLTSDRFRDRGRNVADCLEKLRGMLASVATPPRPRKPTRPASAARARRLDQKRRHARTKRLRSAPSPDD